MIDTIHVHRYSVEAINDLMEELGQPRDKSRSWKSIEAEKELYDAFNNKKTDL